MSLKESSAPTDVGKPKKRTTDFCCSDKRLGTSTALFACMFLHLDRILSSDSIASEFHSDDKQFLDIKGWSSICTVILLDGVDSGKGQRVPRPSDEDFKVMTVIWISIHMSQRGRSDRRMWMQVAPLEPGRMGLQDGVGGKLCVHSDCYNPAIDLGRCDAHPPP